MLPKEKKTLSTEVDEQRRAASAAHLKSSLRSTSNAFLNKSSSPSLKQQSGPREKLTRAMRMNTFEVTDVLKSGRRSRVKTAVQMNASTETNAIPVPFKPIIEARILARTNATTPTVAVVPVKYRVASEQIGVRLAAAVPKRWLKKSVDRNLVKRWMREAVRQHAYRFARADLLLTLTAKFDPKNPEDRVRVRQELAKLITDALSLVRASSKSHKFPNSD